MKALVVGIFICALSALCSAQTIVPGKMINNNYNYKIELTITQNKIFQYKIINATAPNQTMDFDLLENNETAFVNAFSEKLKDEFKKIGFANEEMVRAEARKLFYYFQAGEILSDELETKPIAGYLEFNNDTANVYRLSESHWILKASARQRIKCMIKDSENKSKIDSFKHAIELNDLSLEDLIDRKDTAAQVKTSCDCSRLTDRDATELSQKTDSLERIENYLNDIARNPRREYIVQNLSQDLERFKNSLTEDIILIRSRMEKRGPCLAIPESVYLDCSTAALEYRRLDATIKRSKMDKAMLSDSLTKYTIAEKMPLGFLWFEKRIFKYRGTKYSRKGLRSILRDEIASYGDSSKIKPYIEYLKKIKDSVHIQSEIFQQTSSKVKEQQGRKIKADEDVTTAKAKMITDSTEYGEKMLLLERNFATANPSYRGRFNIGAFLPNPRNPYYEQMTQDLFAYSAGRDYSIATDIERRITRLRNQLKTEKNRVRADDLSARLNAEEDALRFLQEDAFLTNNEAEIVQVGSKFSRSFSTWQKALIRKMSYDSIIFVNSNRMNEISEWFKPKRDSLFLLMYKAYDPSFYSQKLLVSQVDIEFNEGFIENVLVRGRPGNYFKYINKANLLRDTLLLAKGAELKLENRHPFGFSRKTDYENVKNKYLFTIDNRVPYHRLYLREILLAYTQDHEINRRDYSPADIVVRINANTAPARQVLYKDQTYRLFEAKVYSDFVGLDGTSPNGLLQTEIDKRINLRTTRKPVGKREGINIGWLGYIVPAVTISKLEENNKDLLLGVLDDTVNNVYQPKKFASTLELRRHENFSTGFDLNGVLIDIPTGKSTFIFDAGVRYGRVSIVDSVKRNIEGVVTTSADHFGVNTFRIYPKIGWMINTDGRYSFYVEASHNFYWLLDNSFVQVANEDVYRSSLDTGSSIEKAYTNLQFQLMLRTGAEANKSKGKLFFRYQYNSQFRYARTGFHQAQVGYSFFLLGRSRAESSN